jgi:hypothetical protein
MAASSKQHAVLWLGMLLIIVRLFTTNQWSTLWKTVTTPSGLVTPGGGVGSGAASGAINCSILGVGSPPYYACIAANAAKGLLADGTPKSSITVA